MAPYISQNRVVQQSSYSASSQITDIQSETSQEDEKQQPKENENIKEVNSEETKIYTNDPTLIGSNDGSLSNNSTASTGQETVKSIKDVSERIDAIDEALAEISKGIKSIEENIGEDVVKGISSDIQDKVYKKQVAKPRLIVGSRDVNYKKDKGGNHHMALMYDSGNNITFSKDDNPVIIIKNDNVKNEGDYWRFVAKIRECCEQKKGYYFEDYLKDHGFMKKEEERIAAIKEAKERIAAYMDSYIKKFGGIQK